VSRSTPWSSPRRERAEIIAFAKARLGGVKAPKSVEFVDAIPRTAAGKMDKKALRCPARDNTGAMPSAWWN
jgi:acyl-CoA synthetase (AMP-forming)/AMP-acid ligase II